MRGIAAGQKIHLYIIPEVQELMSREIKRTAVEDSNELANVVSWLVINSMYTEQVMAHHFVIVKG